MLSSYKRINLKFGKAVKSIFSSTSCRRLLYTKNKKRYKMVYSKNIIPKNVNPDLQKERKSASFNSEEFAAWFYGGIDKLKFKRDFEQFLYEDLEDDAGSIHYLSHDEIYDYAVRRCVQIFKKLRAYQEKHNPGGKDIWPGLVDTHFVWGANAAGNPFGVAIVMAGSAIKNEGTDEQYEEFGKRMEKVSICASYAQTEMGHGTFLRGLETRADFDRQTDEFVLNTPTLSSYKWWPGGLGHTANYCILVARLHIDNESKGVQMFLVQLRDEETHLPLPGISVGDIGKKIGFYGVNNGYLGLKDVRIPRKNMLMRYAKVQRDGTFTKSPVSALTYFTMLEMRCFIVENNTLLWALAAVIATRYSAVRRQSPINPDENEPQIMDHVTQQLKIFPEIASFIAAKLCSNYLKEIYEKTSSEISSGVYDRLPELHALTCAVKALCTYDAANGVETLRLACGGHGYLLSSNMGPLYAAATAACTYEGENTVLLLQVGRFLMKTWHSVLTKNASLGPTVEYLSYVAEKTDFGEWTGTWRNIVDALEFVTVNKIRLAFEKMSERLKSGQTQGEAANNTGIELIQIAELHGRCFIANTFFKKITGMESQNNSASLNKVLELLLELYLVNTAFRHMNDILRITEAELRSLQNRLESALSRIRPEAVAICDGFDFHDRVVNSTLGSYDGNVYERLFDAAQKSPLNQQAVSKTFHEVLKPFLKSNL